MTTTYIRVQNDEPFRIEVLRGGKVEHVRAGLTIDGPSRLMWNPPPPPTEFGTTQVWLETEANVEIA